MSDSSVTAPAPAPASLLFVFTVGIEPYATTLLMGDETPNAKVILRHRQEIQETTNVSGDALRALVHPTIMGDPDLVQQLQSRTVKLAVASFILQQGQSCTSAQHVETLILY